MTPISPKIRQSLPGAAPLDFAARVDMVRRSTGFQFNKDRHFATLGEQLVAVAGHAFAQGTPTDRRLVRAPLGGSEIDPTGGGFLVQTDFATALLANAHDVGEIMRRCRVFPVGDAHESIKIPVYAETSRATGSRWGGLLASQTAEGVQSPDSSLKFSMVEIEPRKLIVIYRVSNEMLNDTSTLEGIVSAAVADELSFVAEDSIINGRPGQFQGILQNGALITVPKEAGQVAGTVVAENIQKIWARCWPASRRRAVWLVNSDIEPQLWTAAAIMNVPGVAPADEADQDSFQTLFGRPVIPTEYNTALGGVGDIILADLGSYAVAPKMPALASSLHVAFLTDQMAFRFTWRVAGTSHWVAPIVPYKGTITKSPFITLGAR